MAIVNARNLVDSETRTVRMFEINNDTIDVIQKKATEIMEQATLPYLDLDVPLKVEGGQGINWSLAH